MSTEETGTGQGDGVVDQGTQDQTGEATFQNGAGETAPISAIADGEVKPIEEAPTLKVESLAPAAAPAPVAPAPAPVVSAPVKTAPVVQMKQPEAPKGFKAMIEEIKANGTTEEKKLIANVEQYMTRMAPGLPMSGDEGARHQHALWKVIQGLVERAPQDQFRRLWNILLGYFEENKDGVFGDRYVFRFAESWHHSEAELSAFQRILNVIKLTSNANERSKGLRQVDLGRSLETGFTEEARQRLLTFYQQ